MYGLHRKNKDVKIKADVFYEEKNQKHICEYTHNNFNVESNALSQRTYLRYDYTNPNASPFEYTISVPDTVF